MQQAFISACPALSLDEQVNKYQWSCFGGSAERCFSSCSGELNTGSKDRGAGADGEKRESWAEGCLRCLSKLPSLETNSVRPPACHKHRQLEVLHGVFTLPQPRRRGRLSGLGDSFCSLPWAWQ